MSSIFLLLLGTTIISFTNQFFTFDTTFRLRLKIENDTLTSTSLVLYNNNLADNTGIHGVPYRTITTSKKNGIYEFTGSSNADYSLYTIAGKNGEPLIDPQILEPGDDIFYTIKNGSWRVSGYGSEKLLLQKDLAKDIAYPENLDNSSSDQTSFVSIKNKYQLKKLRLEKAAKKVSTQVYTILEQKIIHDYYLEYENLAYSKSLIIRDSTVFRAMKDSYYENKIGRASFNIDTALLQVYPWNNVFEYLIQTEFNTILFDQKQSNSNYAPYSDHDIVKLFAILNKKYSRLLLDKILIRFFARDFRCNKTDSLLHEAINIVKSDPEKELLSSLYKKIGKGMPAYPFVLSDTAGKAVSLADLKGSILLINTWIQHCGPCEGLIRNLEPVIEKFKNANDVKFISLNGDSNKKDWIEGIKSGKHTSTGQIILHQDPNAKGNNLLRHYNFFGFPNMLLVDKKGKVLAVRITRPTTKENTNALIDLIENNR